MRAIFRADASVDIGSGHVMRCLCLADRLAAAGVETVFVSRDLPAFLQRRLEAGRHRSISLSRSSCMSEVTDVEETLRGIDTADLIILDHYGLGAAWERVARSYARVLAIDDIGRVHESDLLLDQNFYLEAQARYEGRLASGAIALLGPRYALLRPEFREGRSVASFRDRGVGRILVSLGGMDRDDVTSVALEAIDQANISGVHVDVVVGAIHPASARIRKWCSARARSRLHVQVSNIAELMVAADLAIGAGGQSAWERCSVGLPSIAICVADNQREVVREGARAGFLLGVESIPTAEQLAEDIRLFVRRPTMLEAMSRRGYDIVDARGVDRLATILCPPTVIVRAARMEDARSIYGWRTDEAVRQASRDAALFSYDEHCAWMRRVLADSRRMLLIGECEGRPIGAIRFDLQESKAEVSIFVDPEQKGRGLGLAILRAGERHLAQRIPEVERIEAWVNEGNRASEGLFGRAEYEPRMRFFEKRI